MNCSFMFSLLMLVGVAVGNETHECGRSYIDPGKIVGGNVSAEGQWPWAVALTLLSPTCTGSIISPRHILTAGHCALQGAEFYSVWIGSVDIGKRLVKASVLKITPHPELVLNCTEEPPYVCYEIKNDIAIMELGETLNFTKRIRPICLPLNFTEEFGEDAYSAGWGMHEKKLPNGTSVIAGQDQLLRDTVVAFHPCLDVHVANLEDVICAGAEGRGTNHGDSGGPLMANRGGVWYQVGVSSFIDDNHPFRQDKYPATFTRITSYCEWIEKATDGAAKCQSIP